MNARSKRRSFAFYINSWGFSVLLLTLGSVLLPGPMRIVGLLSGVTLAGLWYGPGLTIEGISLVVNVYYAPRRRRIPIADIVAVETSAGTWRSGGRCPNGVDLVLRDGTRFSVEETASFTAAAAERWRSELARWLDLP